jgi:hypothetical protein
MTNWMTYNWWLTDSWLMADWLKADWLTAYCWLTDVLLLTDWRLIAWRFELERWRLTALNKFGPKERTKISTSWAPVRAKIHLIELMFCLESFVKTKDSFTIVHQQSMKLTRLDKNTASNLVDRVGGVHPGIEFTLLG